MTRWSSTGMSSNWPARINCWVLATSSGEMIIEGRVGAVRVASGEVRFTAPLTEPDLWLSPPPALHWVYVAGGVRPDGISGTAFAAWLGDAFSCLCCGGHSGPPYSHSACNGSRRVAWRAASTHSF